jgi:glycine cleavage system protein P-like pyridoxal-binding family
MHDTGCPGFDLLVTDHAKQALSRLKGMYGITGLTPRGWQYFERVGEQLHDRSQLTAGAIVARMRDVAIDWKP